MTNYSSLIAFLLLCLCGVSSSLTKAHNGGFSVELIHRDSSRSPFYRPTETQYQRIANAFRRSINRVNHFNKASSSITTNAPESIVTPDGGEYLMTYTVGSPPFNLFGIVDTGSDLVWLQCKPCEVCYNQTSPTFDPSKSTTYRTIPCTSITCTLVQGSSCSATRHHTPICQYTINYGDNSHSQGDLARETLTLRSTTVSHVSFPNTVVGCGHSNTVSFQGKSSGVVGLGQGPVSLVSQLKSSIKGKFSYCLVPVYTGSKLSSSSSKLNFGDNAVVSGRGVVSTPIVPPRKDQSEIFYFLTLKAFSVGNKRVGFGGGKGNIIIDSGTTLTLLPTGVYNELESAVARVVKLPRADDPEQQLSLCYKAASEKLDVPLITAHFEGADVQLNALNTFVQVADDVVCFAFSATDQDISIFGNLAQQNLLVGYDLQKKIVSFKPADCTKQ